jgi:hypothetical protein
MTDEILTFFRHVKNGLLGALTCKDQERRSHDANMEQEGGGGRSRGRGPLGQHSGKSKQSFKKEKKC